MILVIAIPMLACAWVNIQLVLIFYDCVMSAVHNSHEGIEMRPNEVYGINTDIETTPCEVYGVCTDIKTTPNEVYGVTTDIKTTPNEVYGVMMSADVIKTSLNEVYGASTVGIRTGVWTWDSEITW